MVRVSAICVAVMLVTTLCVGADAAHTKSVPPRFKEHTDIMLNIGGKMIRASPSASTKTPSTSSKTMRLRGGGNAHGATPKYQSNRALNQDEYAAPYGTIMRTRSGAMIAPTPTPECLIAQASAKVASICLAQASVAEASVAEARVAEASVAEETAATDKLLMLRQWYAHLVKLGVTSIYFSPIFESETHGYDTVDYFMIDRRVGDLAMFKTIVKELHELGIKVILDGVFNHTGRSFFAFKALLEAGANWPQCEYKDWYFISEGSNEQPDKYPEVDGAEHVEGLLQQKMPLTEYAGDGFKYRSWEGHMELPELNVENPDVRDYLFKVAKFWLGDVGVDGWRLDVAHELPPAFWRDFRTACTEANPEHVLLGEVIHGDYNTWVGPGKGLLHSGTNYQLSKALWSSLKEHNFWELDAAVQRDLMLYREMSLVNFLSNHDVARVATQFEGEPELNKVAHFMLLTFRGVPCIYYGDEVGVKGRKEDGDAALRMAMLPPDPALPPHWPPGGQDLFNMISALVKFRALHPALILGAHQPLYHQNNEMVWARRTPDGKELLVCAVNSAGEHSHVEVFMGCLDKPAGTPVRALWGDGADCGSINDQFKVRIHLPPYGMRILTLTPEEAKPPEEPTSV